LGVRGEEAFGLAVLNYVVTSNHIHLLVKDTGDHVISQSMQLIAGRSAQEFNQRKGRQGAFWEDRYHATAIEVDEHLHRCLVYIDLNMARAGVVEHPSQSAHGGYREILAPPKRYAIIDLRQLSALCGFAEASQFQQAHRQWVIEALRRTLAGREDQWSEALAVGSLPFVEKLKTEFGVRAMHRATTAVDGMFTLLEQGKAYTSVFAAKNDALRLDNTRFYEEKAEIEGT